MFARDATRWSLVVFFFISSLMYPFLSSTFATQNPTDSSEHSLGKGSYVLSPGDLIDFTLSPEDPYIKNSQLRVSSRGKVRLPLLGDIEVAGLSVDEAEKRLENRIRRDFIIAPNVHLQVKRSTKNKQAEKVDDLSFSILGHVKRPGQYVWKLDADQPVTFIQALTMAGGFTSIANASRVKIVRFEDGKKISVKINGEAILNGSQQDVEIKNGDRIHVFEDLF